MMFYKQRTENYAELCQTLGYSFRNKGLLLQALTRKTAVIEDYHRGIHGDYQRIEFLGDKVIGLAISTILFDMHPAWEEGRLTRINSQFTSNNTLAQLAKHLDLGKYLILGKSDEWNHVRENTKALADVVESLFGAIFIDSGKDYKLIEKLILKHWEILDLEQLISTPSKESSSSASSSASCSIYQPEDELDKALIKACHSGTASEVKTLLEKGAKPNVASEINSAFKSALQFSAQSRDAYEKMELLLQAGAEPNWQTGYRLVDVMPVPRIVSCSFFLEKGTYKKYFDQQTVLHIIIQQTISGLIKETDAINIIKLLLKYHVSVNVVNADAKTPLQLAYDYQTTTQEQNEYYGEESEAISSARETTKLNGLISLLEHVSTIPEPTSPAKFKQDIMNAVQEDLLATAFSDLPEEFGEDMAAELTGFMFQ